MTIDEAIKELAVLYRLLAKDTAPKFLTAIGMGGAALRRLRRIRPDVGDALQGED